MLGGEPRTPSSQRLLFPVQNNKGSDSASGPPLIPEHSVYSWVSWGTCYVNPALRAFPTWGVCSHKEVSGQSPRFPQQRFWFTRFTRSVVGPGVYILITTPRWSDAGGPGSMYWVASLWSYEAGPAEWLPQLFFNGWPCSGHISGGKEVLRTDCTLFLAITSEAWIWCSSSVLLGKKHEEVCLGSPSSTRHLQLPGRHTFFTCTTCQWGDWRCHLSSRSLFLMVALHLKNRPQRASIFYFILSAKGTNSIAAGKICSECAGPNPSIVTWNCCHVSMDFRRALVFM